MTFFPDSPVVGPVSDAVLEMVAEEALDAFFSVVAHSLDDLYPGSRTWGDEFPGEYVERRRVARAWIESFATNNDVVASANQEEGS